MVEVVRVVGVIGVVKMVEVVERVGVFCIPTWSLIKWHGMSRNTNKIVIKVWRVSYYSVTVLFEDARVGLCLTKGDQKAHS